MSAVDLAAQSQASNPTITVQVRLFAAAAQLAGTSSVQLRALCRPEASITDIDQIGRQLCNEFPQLRGIVQQSRWAVGNEFVSAQYPVQSEQTVALIPPVSGG
ncbi:MAG: MoaD/ThiS family protein [Pirellulaceae bacterium]|nr:MoaD/ThiS family protein [Pirellulaceae bacterium]